MNREELVLTNQLAIINMFILYIGLMMAIGVYYYRQTRNMSDYFLGNRKLGAWVTSMSAEASDMSGWMLMGVPGFAYLAGLNAGWIAVGIALGTWANWHFVAARLRKYTELAKNSLTVPQFLENNIILCDTGSFMDGGKLSCVDVLSGKYWQA